MNRRDSPLGDPHRLLPFAEQTACYGPWLKVSVALRYVLTYPWSNEAWEEVRQHIPWLPAEESRLRRGLTYLSRTAGKVYT